MCNQANVVNFKQILFHGVFVQLIHVTVDITRESTHLTVLWPLTRCEVVTHLALYISARRSCLHSVEFFSGTDHIVALCSVRKCISSHHPSLVSKLRSYSYIQYTCIHISDLFGNSTIRKGFFYSVTVLPTGPS